MKKLFLLPVLSFMGTVFAQTPEDALRMSYFPQNGTARSIAIGGAMGSLGGDINALFVNPAGLGNYKTCEWVISPAFSLLNTNINFRDQTTGNQKGLLGMGPIGIVIGGADENKYNTSRAISLGITQTASFNNSYHYSGLNNYSSFSEQWAEEVSKSRDSINGILNNTAYAFGSAPALYNYLVDTFRVNGNLVVKALPEFLLENGNALRQEYSMNTKGGIYEIALGYAVNKKERWQIGGSLGFPIIDYHNTSIVTESDTSSNTQNRFGSFTYTDNTGTTGAGVNLKLGIIYRPAANIRLGFALHTPTFFFSLKDTRSTSLVANTENYKGIRTIGSDLFLNGENGLNKNMFFSPLKLMLSGSYIFSETEDVRKQRGFITGDIEYVNYHGMSYHASNDQAIESDIAYYHSLNAVIRDQYKANFNFRLGGELKFNTVLFRAGFAYYGNPYQDPALKASKTLWSGGIGYRNKGYFFDLGYVYANEKDVQFPYRLQDKDNTFASIQTIRNNFVITVGCKF